MGLSGGFGTGVMLTSPRLPSFARLGRTNASVPTRSITLSTNDYRLSTGPALQRNIPMLLRRILIPLSLQHSQRLDQLLASLSRLDYCIHKSAIRRHVGISQPLAKFFNLFLANRLAIFSAVQLAFVDDIHRALRT